MAPRHNWQPEERDTLQILCFEYGLTGEHYVSAHKIFAILWPWSKTAKVDVVVISQWQYRGATGKRTQWLNHDRDIGDYTDEQQQRRARVRALILRAAADAGVTLSPIPGAVALHNAALATLATGPPPQATPDGEQASSSAAPGSAADTTGETSGTKGPAGEKRQNDGSAGSPQTRKPARMDPKDSEQESSRASTGKNGGNAEKNGSDNPSKVGGKRPNDGSAGSPPTRKPARGDPTPNPNAPGNALIDPDRLNVVPRTLCMVHRDKLAPLTDPAGTPIPGRPFYQTAHEHVFGSPDGVWRRCGLVINVFIPGTLDKGGSVPDGEYHVMICRSNFCNECRGEPGESLGYDGLPLVHSSSCGDPANVERVFSPHWSIDRPRMVDCQWETQRVTYYERGRSLRIDSYMCRIDTCRVCSQPTKDIAGEDLLRMVHRSKVLDYQPRPEIVSPVSHTYICQYGDTFNHTSADWHHGGPVLRVFIPNDVQPDPTQDAGTTWDLMVCKPGSCEQCPSGVNLAYAAYRHPFVHASSCTTRAGDSEPTFNPVQIDTRDELVILAEVDYKSIIYTGMNPSASRSVSMMSAVCIPEKCSVCNSTGNPASSQESDRDGARAGLDSVAAAQDAEETSGGGIEPTNTQSNTKRSGATQSGISSSGNKQSRTEEASGPPSNAALEDDLQLAEPLAQAGETDSQRTLTLIHWADLKDNTDNNGRRVAGWVPYRAEHRHRLGPQNPVHSNGGMVMNVYMLAGVDEKGDYRPSGLWHVMACDLASCKRCSPIQAVVGSSFRGYPCVHASDCQPPLTGTVFNPPWNVVVNAFSYEQSEIARRVHVTFSQGAGTIRVTALICEARGCPLCSARMPNNNRLKMVHYTDLDWNQDKGRKVIRAAPRYKAQFDALFSQGGDDPMWEQGGPVMNVFVPGSGNRPDSQHHVMLCNVRGCQRCFDNDHLAITPSGVMQVDNRNTYDGWAFTHRTDLLKIPTLNIFHPNWMRELDSITKTQALSDPLWVQFFEAGAAVHQLSHVCKPDTCPVCTPNWEGCLRMVHRRRLRPTVLRADSSGVVRVAFSSSWRHLRDLQDPEWHRGGPVMRIFVPDLAAQGVNRATWDVMVCQYQACDECFDEEEIPQRHKVQRTPFVHRKYCTDNPNTKLITFRPDPDAELERVIDCRVEQKQVVYFQRGVGIPTEPVESSVCIRASCPVCNVPEGTPAAKVPEGSNRLMGPPPVPKRSNGRPAKNVVVTGGSPKRPAATGRGAATTRAQMTGTGSGGRTTRGSSTTTSLPATASRGSKNRETTVPPTSGPPGRTTRSQSGRSSRSNSTELEENPSVDQKPPTGARTGRSKTEGPTATATAYDGTALRMCHKRHLTFKGDATVSWYRDPKSSLGGMIDNYFVPEGSEAYSWGGPTYRVNFPDTKIRDVMSCITYKCSVCKGGGPTGIKAGGQKFNGRPMTHRREVVILPSNSRVFTPVPKDRYFCLPIDTFSNMTTTTRADYLTYDRGGRDGASAVVARTDICMPLNCAECDRSEEEEPAEAVETAEEDDQPEDEDEGQETQPQPEPEEENLYD